MITADFSETDIPWAGGKALFSWWLNARGERQFPARRDFSPFSVSAHLSTLQLIDVGDNRNYSVRLIGTGITEILGFDPTGKALDDIPNTANVRSQYDWVVENKKPLLGTNLPIPWSEKAYKSFSVIVMPLGPDDDTVAMLLLSFHYGKI